MRIFYFLKFLFEFLKLKLLALSLENAWACFLIFSFYLCFQFLNLFIVQILLLKLFFLIGFLFIEV